MTISHRCVVTGALLSRFTRASSSPMSTLPCPAHINTHPASANVVGLCRRLWRHDNPRDRASVDAVVPRLAAVRCIGLQAFKDLSEMRSSGARHHGHTAAGHGQGHGHGNAHGQHGHGHVASHGHAPRHAAGNCTASTSSLLYFREGHALCARAEPAGTSRCRARMSRLVRSWSGNCGVGHQGGAVQS